MGRLRLRAGQHHFRAIMPDGRVLERRVEIDAYRNRDLFVNSVNWLMGDVEAISIRPRQSRASRFQLTTQDFLRIRSMSLFVLPEAIAIAGVIVWWKRRRAPERS